MQTYRRFVSYVYQYENGKKSGNRGFIKVEAKGNTCSLQISLKGICRDGNGVCNAYGFKREEGLLKGSLLAECPVRTGIVQEQLVFLRNEMGEAGYSLHDLSGVIFRGDDETMYGTQWDDEPMKMENFQPDERRSGSGGAGPHIADAGIDGSEKSGSGTFEAGIDRSGMSGSGRAEPEIDGPQMGGAGTAEESAARPETGEAGMAEAEIPGPEISRAEIEEAEISGPEISRAEIEEAKMPGPEITGAEMTEPEMPGSEITGAEMAEPKMPGAEMAGTGAADPEIAGSDAVRPESARERITEPKGAGISQVVIEAAVQEEAGAQETGTQGTEIQETEIQETEAREIEMQETAEPEEKWMPPKEQDPPAADGARSGRDPIKHPEEENRVKMSVYPPGESRDGNIPGIRKPQGSEREELVGDRIQTDERTQAAQGMDRWEEDPGLPEVLDTTVVLPDAQVQEGSSQEYGEYEEEVIVPDQPGHIVPEMEAENVQEEMPQERSKPGKKEFFPFTDGVLEDCRRISMADLKCLDPRDQGMQNNRFVQHGYQMFGHLLLAKITRNSQYILGVPGMYQKQEKFMADMFGFHNFKCARKNGNRPACFGYWYRLIYPPKSDRRDCRAD